MDKHLARQYFIAGKVHPQCPNCGHGRLRIMGTVKQGVEFWREYYCLQCGENFSATVEPEVDITT